MGGPHCTRMASQRGGLVRSAQKGRQVCIRPDMEEGAEQKERCLQRQEALATWALFVSRTPMLPDAGFRKAGLELPGMWSAGERAAGAGRPVRTQQLRNLAPE